MKMTERKPRSKKTQTKPPPPQVGGRQFRAGNVYPIDVDVIHTVPGKHMHIETKRRLRGSFWVHQVVPSEKELTLLGELIENGEHYVVRIGKGVPR